MDIIGKEKQDFDYAINIVYEVCDQLWLIQEQYDTGDSYNDCDIHNITKHFARSLDKALKILERERSGRKE